MVLATPFDLLLLTKKIAHSYCSRWFRNVVYHHNFGNKTYLTYNLLSSLLTCHIINCIITDAIIVIMELFHDIAPYAKVGI